MKVKLTILMLFMAMASYSQNKNRALIIGVSDYKELPKGLQLQYADDDAVEFYKFIRSKAIGNIDSTDIKLLLNENATAAQIYSALDELIDVTQANDKVIIYFSGHGDIETKTVRQRGFLLAHDSPKAGYQVGGTVKLSDLQDYLETLVATNKARVILITDACRSGKLAGGEAGAAQTTAVLHEQWGSITKILSSQAGELSGESSEWGSGHGVFTFNLINGLTGLADNDKDGWVSLTELNIFLSTEVPKATFDSQHPVVSGNLGTKMSRVDKVQLASLLAKTKANSNAIDPATLLASNKGVFAGLDTLSKRLYNDFLTTVKGGNLLLPETKNAFSFYRQLYRINERNTPFINDLKRVLVANLEDQVQKVLNRYMKQDRTITDAEYALAHQELDSALTLVPRNYPRYNNITAKRLFLKADLIECTCDPEAVADEEARRSLAVLKEAIALEPEMAYLHNSLGSAYFFLEKYDSAILSYNTANRMAPAWVYPINNLGTVYKELKDYDKAVSFYKKSVELAPDNGWAYSMLVSTYSYNLKAPHLALRFAVERARLEGSSNAYNQLGVVYYDRFNDLVSAQYAYEKALSIDSTNVDALINLGGVKTDSYRPEDGIIDFEKAATLDSTSRGYTRLGDAFSQTGDDRAVESYKEAIKRELIKSTKLPTLGELYLKAGETEKAIESFKKVISLDPKSLTALGNLGQQYFELEDYDRAIEYFNQVTKITSTDGYWFYILGQSYYKNKNSKEAIKNFNKAIEIYKPYGEAYFRLAEVYLNLNVYDSAVKNIKKGNEFIGQSYYDGYFNLSDALLKKDKARSAYFKGKGYEEENDKVNALKYYKKAISLNPKLTEAYSAISDFYDSDEEVIQNYEKAVSINPTWTNGFVKLGDLYEDNRSNEDANTKKAIDSYERALKLDSRRDDVYVKLGDLYNNEDENEKAIAAYEKAIQIDSTEDRFIQLGKLYQRKQEYFKAIKSYEMATNLAPTSSKGFIELGDLFNSQKENDKAIAQYEKAVERYSTYYISPDFDGSTNFDVYDPSELRANLLLFAVNRSEFEAGESNIELTLFWLEIAAKSGFDIQSSNFIDQFLAGNEQYKKLIDRYPSYESQLRQGELYKSKNEYDSATESYKKAVIINPKGIEGLMQLGWLYTRVNAKQFDVGVEYYKKAIQFGSVSASIELGDLYLKKKQYEPAIANYKAAAARSQTDTKAFIKLGWAFTRMNQIETANEYFEKAIQIGSSYTIVELGDLYKDNSEYDHAMEWYRRAADANSKGTDAFMRLGDMHRYYLKVKSTDKSIEQYLKVLEIDTTYSLAYDRLGLAFLDNKNYDKAIEYFLKGTKYYQGHNLMIGGGGNSYIENYGQLYLSLGTAYFNKGNQQMSAVSNGKGYLINGDLTNSLSFLEKAAQAGYDISDPFFFNELKDNEQYKKLLVQYPKKK